MPVLDVTHCFHSNEHFARFWAKKNKVFSIKKNYLNKGNEEASKKFDQIF
jgi:hypothetical protein